MNTARAGWMVTFQPLLSQQSQQFCFSSNRLRGCNITKMPNRKCIFNLTLQNQYAFIEQQNSVPDVTCEKFRTYFCVGLNGANYFGNI